MCFSNKNGLGWICEFYSMTWQEMNDEVRLWNDKQQRSQSSVNVGDLQLIAGNLHPPIHWVSWSYQQQLLYWLEWYSMEMIESEGLY